MALDARAGGAAPDLLAVAVDVNHLVGEVHDDAHGAGGRGVGVPDVLVRPEVGRVRGLRGAFLNRQGGEARDRQQ